MAEYREFPFRWGRDSRPFVWGNREIIPLVIYSAGSFIETDFSVGYLERCGRISPGRVWEKPRRKAKKKLE